MRLDETVIGKGRSGVVLATDDSNIVEKRFHSKGLEKVIQTLFFGAPNYDADEDAVLTAYYRREVLSYLVEFWFDNKLRVAKPKYVGYNKEEAAFKLGMEFIKGRAPKLLSPFQHDNSELEDLVKVMKELQGHLEEAGFIGSQWQAGKGNPVALNNFLLEDDTSYKWAMVDCESGVPPIAPSSLQALHYYFNQSCKIRRLLFDDVDINKLEAYIHNNENKLEKKLGENYNVLLNNIYHLKIWQSSWKSKTRVEKGVEYHLAKGKLSENKANWYLKHPFVWYARELGRGVLKAYDKLVGDLPTRAFVRLTTIDYCKVLANSIIFFLSEGYRIKLGKECVNNRINEWQQKGRLKKDQIEVLRKELERSIFTDYIADFGVHLAIYPTGKIIEALAIPALYASNHRNLATFLLFYGISPILRGIYTTGRFIQSCIDRKEKPYTALIGWLPVAGNLAYPLQMVVSSLREHDELPMFVTIDIITETGKEFPIWGGSGTLTEHRFNNLGYRIGKYFGRKNGKIK